MWLRLSGPYAHSTYLSPNMTAGDLTVAMEITPLLPAHPPPSAWKCPRLLIWDHTSPPPPLCVNKSTFLLFWPVSNRVYCKWKMAWGTLRRLTALSLALQLEEFLEWFPISILPRIKTDRTCLLHNALKFQVYLNTKCDVSIYCTFVNNMDSLGDCTQVWKIESILLMFNLSLIFPVFATIFWSKLYNLLCASNSPLSTGSCSPVQCNGLNSALNSTQNMPCSRQ